MPAQNLTRPALRSFARFLPGLSFRTIVDAVVEADRRYREARKFARLDYPYLEDMGIDLGRTRETRR